MISDLPKVYQDFIDVWERQRETLLDAYQKGRQSFVPNLLPELAVGLTAQETLSILRRRLGERLDVALDHKYTDPDNLPVTVPQAIQSPVVGEPDGSWLKKSNMVAINVRTIGSHWNVVKYILTIPDVQDSVQLLPIWEAGVVGSIYGISSWQLNLEFYSQELAEACPHLDTVGKQLKAVVNILHAMGKTVGMDVIPHTDRYSEIALAHPQYFEWLQRQDTVIVDHSANLHREVQDRIMDFVAENGPAVSGVKELPSREVFFSSDFDADRRLRILFGLPEDHPGREARRNELIKYLYCYGYEPVPGTMAPPFRGLEVDTREEAKIVDAQGMVWRDYVITKPEKMSRVFGPLGRFKLYGRLNDNKDWEVDFDNPNREAWDYVCERYYDVQRRYGFDFMRGDMSHVQMRPDGVPNTIDRYYDILGTVKNYIQQDQGVSHFGYFAETFLPPRDVFGYGEEMDHLEASDADTTLGDLQSCCVGSTVFMQRFRQYYDFLESRACVPNFTVMTADKDDPRFDEFYLKGNEVRLFIAFFVADMPSYMGLGYQVRDVHYEPAPNEHYTKLFVFQERVGHKATFGPYVWGKNGHLYSNITRLKLYADEMFSRVEGRPTRWLIHPDPTAERKVIAWTQKDDNPDYVFVANLDTDRDAPYFAIPIIPHVTPDDSLVFEFSTARNVPEADRILAFNGKHYRVNRMAPGEGRVYRIRYKP